MNPFSPHRIILAALRGGSGKTILSIGLASAWGERGYRVAPFKKGPDFIDAAWLTLAAGRTCYNLDAFMMPEDRILRSFLTHSAGADISLIEGNRGLFDGLDPEGRYSTAELGRRLRCPVVLIVDVSMSTRTVAALIRGCQSFEEDLHIAGVILNRVAGPRQEALIGAAVDRHCGLPIVGSVPKLKGSPFPERHMGLVPYQERAHAEEALSWARSTAEKHLDLDALRTISENTPPLQGAGPDDETPPPSEPPEMRPRIGYIRDRAFWFYYPENLERLQVLGATLVEIRATEDTHVPQLDGLYIGGGFPETQAEALARNRPFRDALRLGIEGGLPVYAECGGLLYLGETLLVDGNSYPMVGALPIGFSLEKRPQGHGYTVMEVTEKNPYYPVGEVFRGHEFHYSRPLGPIPKTVRSAFQVRRGRGLDGEHDGLCIRNLLATFTHIHAAGLPLWGENLYRAAVRFKRERLKDFQAGGK